MRLPADTDEAVALVRYAIDSGMRYIDTSRGYADSEIKIGRALKDGYRKKVILSTKWSPWVMKVDPADDTSADCMLKRIEGSMKRLDVDYLDYFQVWNIDSREHYDQAVARGGMVDGIRKAIDRKMIGHSGFTTHDKEENLVEYVKEVDWCEIILFTHNLINPTYARAIEAAHARGIGTIIMNPVGGGMLSHDSTVLGPLAEMVGALTVPELAIRFLTSNPAVTAIIAGITKTADVDDTIAAVSRGRFTPEQMATIRKVTGGILAETEKFCTNCRYCLPCTAGIDIPAIMNMNAQYRFWGLKEGAREWYRGRKSPGADACTRCGKCEEKCTQHLQIIDEMDYAAGNLVG